MSKGLIGKKIGMTRLFLQGNISVPVTVIEAGPCSVVQIKTKEKDGYEAIQLGYSHKKHLNKPQEGHLKACGNQKLSLLKEFPLNKNDEEALKVGDTVTADLFTPGEKINVTGTSKGKGFTGVVKRFGFSGGRASHGGRSPRGIGSIGCAATPGRVIKGRKMPGHSGAHRETVQNIIVVDVRSDYGVILVKGAVPGPNGGLVFLSKN